MTERLFKCPHCGKAFADEHGRWQHARSKHGAKTAKPLRPEDDREPSMGELVAEAHRNDDAEFDWVREMFDVPHPTRGER